MVSTCPGPPWGAVRMGDEMQEIIELVRRNVELENQVELLRMEVQDAFEVGRACGHDEARRKAKRA
jgi:hypothetical protein